MLFPARKQDVMPSRVVGSCLPPVRLSRPPEKTVPTKSAVPTRRRPTIAMVTGRLAGINTRRFR